MLAHLGAMLAQLAAMLAHLEPYVGPSRGLCWPRLIHLEPQDPRNGKKGKSTKHRKTRDFLAVRGGSAAGGRGWRQGAGAPSLLRRGEKRRTAMPRPGGPWPDLSAYARQPARGPTMLAHLVAMLAYVDLCWPMLAYLAGTAKNIVKCRRF